MEQKPIGQRRRRRSIIHESCLNTSAYGLSRVARSTDILSRFFWLISFTGFTATMIYFIVRAILAYFEYPTKIDISYVNKWPNYFPAFSLCNLSPVRSDEIIGLLINYSNMSNGTNANGTVDINQFSVALIYDFIVDRMNRNQPIGSFLFSLPVMLQSCSFNNRPCSLSDFVLFTSSLYGFCYTFNAKMKNSSNSTLRLAGQYGGDGILSLGIYLHSHQYVPQMTDSVGLIGLIHGNTQLPLIEAAGVELAAGRKHRLSYSEKTVRFLPAPYSNCKDEVSSLMQMMLDKYNGADYGYSEVICYQLCEQAYVFDQCGCVNPYKWNARSIMLSGTNKIIYTTLCGTNNTCYRDAISVFSASPSLMDQYCADCQTQCEKTDFAVQTSSSVAPIEFQMNDIKLFVENSTVPLPTNWSSTWREQIYSNYLRVDVVRRTGIVEMNTESATLAPVDLFSNIGGQTGLWIGVSFLSLMELVEIIYRLIQHYFRSNRVNAATDQKTTDK
ncbi:unnamed protein product [Adineta ricciae]|uniref:Uncharacterized protein n=1 Tax=Adineta ricciae TaxID=249248 RepID=A0A814DEG7_ADIRI|nr:unnamed protein product [Adineta ricciae]CAF1376589.1 unnamed protein product [Adineta ricciae]